MRTIPFGKPIIGEEEKSAILTVLDSGVYAHGKKIEEFEQKFSNYTGAADSVGVSNCTAALHLLYFNWGLSKDMEVIVPSQTHVATAHSVELAGGKPIFVDAEEKTGNINTELIEEKITDKTVAISVVHYLGMPAEMDNVMKLAAKYGLRVVEDCALSIGAYYKGIHTGLIGDAGCFSFYPVKHITTGEGGMVITKYSQLGKEIRKKRAFGMDKHVGERTIPGVYDVPELGFNYRLNELQAAMGICQLDRIDSFIRQREENYYKLQSGFSQIDEVSLFESTNSERKSSYYCFSLLLKDRIADKKLDIIAKLKEKGIGNSLYYPGPVPMMTYYKNKYNLSEKEFPVSCKISKNSIALPVGPHLLSDDTEYIVNSFKEIISKV